MLEKKKQTPMMQLLRDIAHFEPKKGQKYVELIVTVESDDDDEYFPTVFLELWRVCWKGVRMNRVFREMTLLKVNSWDTRILLLLIIESDYWQSSVTIELTITHSYHTHNDYSPNKQSN